MSKKRITVKKLYDHILKHLTAEQALIKLLEGSLIQYDKLKFDKKGEVVHPLIVISMATLDLGWGFAVESDKENIEGLVIGTNKYMKRIFKNSK